MSTFSSLSLILAEDHNTTEQRIDDCLQAIGKSQWRAEVIVIAPPNSPLTRPPLQAPKRKVVPSLKAAIDAARHPVIALLEPEVSVDANQFGLMLEQIDELPIQSSFTNNCNKQTQPNVIPRLLFKLYSFLIRFLLKVNKTEFDYGLTIFQKDQLCEIPDLYKSLPMEVPADQSREGHNTLNQFVTETLSRARLHRLSVTEARIEQLNIADTATTPSLPQTLKAVQRGCRFWWNSIMFPVSLKESSVRRYKTYERFLGTVGLLLIAAMVFFNSLNYPLFEPDEARNAQLALNVIESGQWMSLTLAEENYWDKPPLQMWAIAASYKIFGVSPFATRLPVAVASMFTILATLLLGKKLLGYRGSWFGGLLLLLTTGFVCVSRYVTMDASLTAMSTIMLLSTYLAVTNGFKRHYAVLASIACGLGILIKGPVIGVLCLPPLILFFWLSPIQKRLPRRWWMWFSIPAFLVSAPWFIATAWIHPDFLTYFFWKHHVVRFSDAFNHREPFWYYLVGIFIFMFPASYLIPSLIKFLTSRRPENRFLRTREQGFLLLASLWIIGFFSISESKLPTYIVPSFPLICLLMGGLLDRKLFSRQTDEAIAQQTRQDGTAPAKLTWLIRTGRRAPFEILFWFTIIGIISVTLLNSSNAPILTTGEFLTGLLIMSGLVTASYVYRQKVKVSWACFAATGLLVVTLSTHRLIPTISIDRSIHHAANQVKNTDEFNSAPIVFFGRETYGSAITLNSDDIVTFYSSEANSLARFIEKNPHTIVVAGENEMNILRHELPWTIEIEEREDARHLYVTRPQHTHPASVAKQPSENVVR
ncbi:MAG: glycosyltransferase family 39 protein [Mariniblastus sp.]|nr:glycosyltransferase family 39 protein [Mariniblastus sp.]